MKTNAEPKHQALRIVEEQLTTATGARKCHSCGCFQTTVQALVESKAQDVLRPALHRAKQVFEPKEYDCLGCSVCYPAIAANAFSEAFPEFGELLDLCPAEEPTERHGWPPLPGDYRVFRFRAPVAVCTLNSGNLVTRLSEQDQSGIALVGSLHTENLGIERVIRNVLANPHIRFLILCGEDTQQTIGHLPGQTLAALFKNGIDERGRIRGAKGKRPVLKNVTRDQVAAFLQQIELVNQIGVLDEVDLIQSVKDCAEKNPGPVQFVPFSSDIEPVHANEPSRLVPDPAGFFVVYPDPSRHVLALEHYTREGVLDCIIEGETPSAVYSLAAQRRLLTRLDHAAYLGQELARAEHSIETGEPYIQDRAAGEITNAAPASKGCGCSKSETCGDTG